jgi:2-octaprenyl-6-methoxyphenol hydroxylase
MKQMHGFDVDVIVAGGGNAGAAFALAAAQAGLSVALVDAAPVERRAAPDFDGRAYALAAATVNALKTLGAWGAVASRAQPFSAIEIFDGRLGDPGPARLRFEGAALSAAPFAALVEDRFLRAALLDAVAQGDAIEHIAPASVEGLEADGGGATARLSDGRALRAAVAIAADGRRSALAAAAGVRWTGRRYGQKGLTCAVSASRPHAGVARQIFYPAGPFAMLPLTGGRVSIVWSERTAEADRIAALDDGAYLAEIALRAGGLLGDIALVGPRWVYPLELSLAQECVAPRLALLGDAAHAIHPIAGQGLNLAFRDIAALAEVLADARRRGEDIGAPHVLERYQRWRRFDSVAFGAGTDAINRLFSNDLGPARLLRDAGLAIVDAAPALKRFFMAEAAGVSGDVPRLLRGEPV